jgi:hypothetical protein
VCAFSSSAPFRMTVPMFLVFGYLAPTVGIMGKQILTSPGKYLLVSLSISAFTRRSDRSDRSDAAKCSRFLVGHGARRHRGGQLTLMVLELMGAANQSEKVLKDHS